MFFSTNFYYSPLHPSSILCFILIMFGFCLNFDLIIRQPEVPSYKSSNSWWPTTTTKQACNTKWQGPTAYQWSATKTLSKGFRKQVFLLFSTLKKRRGITLIHTRVISFLCILHAFISHHSQFYLPIFHYVWKSKWFWNIVVFPI